jgi:predicted HD phosphohydrolase
MNGAEGPDMTAADPVRVIADLFAAEGAGEYLGEAVTQAQHMLQAAALAEGAGAAPATGMVTRARTGLRSGSAPG